MATDGCCRIELLGGLRVEHDGRETARFRTQKTGALLGYLAFYRERSHPREVLIELLWPEDDLEVGRHKLSVALSALRQQLEPAGIPDGAVLRADRASVGLNAEVKTDVAEFEAALRSAAAGSAAERVQWLAAAVQLYRGELLSGYYEEWVQREQQRLAEQFLRALRELAAHLEQAGDLDQALACARRAVGVDPLREEAHRELMRLQAAAGQRSAALRQYRDLKRILQSELGIEPAVATQDLAREIESGGVEERTSGRKDERTTPDRTIHSPTRPFSHSPTHPAPLEPVGGAMPLGSTFYVVRPTDEQFRAAILRGDSIVLVKGARQVGKTSLLARGLQGARDAGTRVILTEFQMLNADQLTSADTLLFTLAETIAEQLDLEVTPADVWNPRGGANLNFSRYLRRHVLGSLVSSGLVNGESLVVSGGTGADHTPALVWGLDEVDRLFTYPFGSEVLGMFRSWHNERALDPTGPWSRLTLAITYATEAHLFVSDLNQSPFNVGTRLTLDDFTLEQVEDLNRRYGSPLRDGIQLGRYYQVVGGHPYLVRRGLLELANHGVGIADFEASAASADWIFGDHLRRLRVRLAAAPDLCAAVREVLHGRPCPTEETFYRLRSGGVIRGGSTHDAQLRCPVYATYLQRHLP